MKGVIFAIHPFQIITLFTLYFYIVEQKMRCVMWVWKQLLKALCEMRHLRWTMFLFFPHLFPDSSHPHHPSDSCLCHNQDHRHTRSWSHSRRLPCRHKYRAHSRFRKIACNLFPYSLHSRYIVLCGPSMGTGYVYRCKIACNFFPSSLHSLRYILLWRPSMGTLYLYHLYLYHINRWRLQRLKKSS